MSVKTGLKKYGEDEKLCLIAELKQLYDYEASHGKNVSELSYDQNQKAANIINFIEEKINRGHTENPLIKARSVLNGRVQRGLYNKEKTASPTISKDAFPLKSIIDAIEGRDVPVTDTEGAYLNARMKDEVIMKIMCPEIDIFCEMDLSLNDFVTKE